MSISDDDAIRRWCRSEMLGTEGSEDYRRAREILEMLYAPVHRSRPGDVIEAYGETCSWGPTWRRRSRHDYALWPGPYEVRHEHPICP